MSSVALSVVQIAAPFLAAGVAVVGVYLTVAQKDRSDRRSEWWRRATWALERTVSDSDYEAETGWVILGGLLDSERATGTEVAIVEALAQRAAQADTGPEQDGEAHDDDIDQQ